MRASFKLDRHPPVARLVRFRVRGRNVFLAVRLSDAGTVRVLAGARVVVPRRARAADSTASASGCRRVSLRACDSISATRRATRHTRGRRRG